MSQSARRAPTTDAPSLQQSLVSLALRINAITAALLFGLACGGWLLHRSLAPLFVSAGFLVLACLVLIARRVQSSLRSFALCLSLYALAVATFAIHGPMSQFYLVGFCVFTALLLPRWAAVAAVLLSTVSIAVAVMSNAKTMHVGAPGGLFVINFCLILLLITLAVSAARSAVEATLERGASDRRALDYERTNLRDLFNAMPDAFFTKNESGVYAYCNESAAVLYEQESAASMLGKTIRDIFDPELVEQHLADDSVVFDGTPVVNREYRFVGKSNKDKWLLTTKAPLRDSDGKVTGLIGVCRDITAFKRAEADKRAIEAELRQVETLKSIAEESSRTKTAFLAMMSHELRTPLNAIIGFSEVLSDGKFGPVNERQLRYLTNILTSGRHLLHLIGGLLDLSKIEAGKLEVTRQKCAMPQLIQEAISVVQPLADLKQIALAFDQQDSAELPFVIADPLRCKQVLFNFLSNAIKFTPKGGSVTVRCSFIEATERLRVAIADTGPGIKPDDLLRLFKPFEQLPHVDATALGGTGLGLALSRQLLALMAGEAGVDSTPGHGSTFYFELPTHDFNADVQLQHDADRAKGVALIVDDDADARELLELTLQRDGFTTHVASTGEGALVLAQRLRPSVIVLDVFLPGIDGWDVLSHLRESAITSHIPVMIATASTDRQRARELGAAEHFIKPIDRVDLIAALRRHGVSAPKKQVHVVALDEGARHLELVRSVLEPAGFVVRTAEKGIDGLEHMALGPGDVVLVDLAHDEGASIELVGALRRHVDPPILVIASENASSLRERLGDTVDVIMPHDKVLEHLVSEINRLMASPK